MQEPLGAPAPKVIFENDDFLALDKPSGLLVHGVKVSSKRRIDEKRLGEPTLVDWLLEHYPQIAGVGDDPVLRPGIVHRLDKETSGIMMAAKNQKTFDFLKSLFQNRKIKKKYEALVFGVPKKDHGIIDAPIGIKSGTLKRSIHSSKMAKEAVTEYRVTKKYETPAGEFSLLELTPKTGRTHQIRVHLASIGHPIVGDRLYGKKSQPEFADRVMLHASSIEFTDEDNHHFAFESQLSTGAFLPKK